MIYQCRKILVAVGILELRAEFCNQINRVSSFYLIFINFFFFLQILNGQYLLNFIFVLNCVYYLALILIKCFSIF